MLAVPDRLEHPVREAQREDVLHGFLAEEVVDPEDLRLVEDAVDDRVERASRGKVGAERLFQDDPPVACQTARAQRPGDAGDGGRRHREVVQQPGRAADLLLRAIDRIRERGRVSGAGRGVAEPRGEGVPGLRIQLAAPELHHRRARVCTEGLVRQRSPGGADDPVAGRQQAGPVKVVEPREDLAPGQIAGRAEQDDHVVARGAHPGTELRWCGPCRAHVVLSQSSRRFSRRRRAPRRSRPPMPNCWMARPIAGGEQGLAGRRSCSSR